MTNTKCCYPTPRDFSALRQKIADKYNTECAFATQIGMNKHQLSYRFRCLTPFKVEEILKICELLDIETGEIGFYFRTPPVQPQDFLFVLYRISHIHPEKLQYLREIRILLPLLQSAFP